VRVWVRTSRNTGVSVGPVALAIAAPFLLAGWLLYAACMIVYLAGREAVEGIEAIARWVEHKQAQRQR
jgi:hypothetical protein